MDCGVQGLCEGAWQACQVRASGDGAERTGGARCRFLKIDTIAVCVLRQLSDGGTVMPLQQGLQQRFMCLK